MNVGTVDIWSRSVRRLILALAILFAVGGIAAAQTYPAKRITVIVPFGPGSGTDGVARIVTQRLAEVLQTTIVVENRAGASGAIGAVADFFFAAGPGKPVYGYREGRRC